MPAKLTDYILERPKAGHPKAETKAASRAHAATSRPAAACHRLQFNRACVLHDGARKQYSAAEFVAVLQQAHMKRAVVNNISLDICTSERAHRMARTKHTERKANDTSGMLRATKDVPKDGDREGHEGKKPPKESLKARKLKARIPAKCPVGDRLFSQLDNMKRHLGTKHHRNPDLTPIDAALLLLVCVSFTIIGQP